MLRQVISALLLKSQKNGEASTLNFKKEKEN